MTKLSETLSRLAAMRMPIQGDAASADRLSDLADFGSNPGNLLARLFVPPGLAGPAPLVVVLHGCTQNAAGYDHGAGWSHLAEEHGFVLLFPEQQRANNPNLCFNWFVPEDIARGGGEALSIRQMIAAVSRRHPVDPARVFVTGLSAGGAMASVMLATYPELFAAGAIIAGVPYGVAGNVNEALDRMRGRGLPDPATLAARVRSASPHKGPWPRVAVWQGNADQTVDPANAEAILAQWRTLHAITGAPHAESGPGYAHRRWNDADGQVAVEAYDIAGMGHGTPIDPSEPDPCGAPGPFFLAAGISSTRRIAEAWGIADAHPAAASSEAPTPVNRVARAATVKPRPLHPVPPEPAAASGIAEVIDSALRKAGLLR